jgi:hypothetical protein
MKDIIRDALGEKPKGITPDMFDGRARFDVVIARGQ